MNERTKKVVAGIVLGTFTLGCATPVFASDEMAETLPVQPVVVEQIESGSMPTDAETYGLGSKVAKEIAEALVDVGFDEDDAEFWAEKILEFLL